MITTAIGATVMGIAIPVTARAVDDMRLSSATRDVERALQTARLRAVAKNRTMILRLNCPGPGGYRIIEVTDVAATDSQSNRCDESVYPYPGPKDNDPATPKFDGPVLRLHSSVSVSGTEVAFTPAGIAGTYSSNTFTPLSATQSVTLTRSANTKTVQVNGLGKINIQ